jgi:hypothetical protein
MMKMMAFFVLILEMMKTGAWMLSIWSCFKLLLEAMQKNTRSG